MAGREKIVKSIATGKGLQKAGKVAKGLKKEGTEALESLKSWWSGGVKKPEEKKFTGGMEMDARDLEAAALGKKSLEKGGAFSKEGVTKADVQDLVKPAPEVKRSLAPAEKEADDFLQKLLDEEAGTGSMKMPELDNRLEKAFLKKKGKKLKSTREQLDADNKGLEALKKKVPKERRSLDYPHGPRRP